MELKKAFTFTPILGHVDPLKPFLIETDVSNLVLGCTLSQKGEDGDLYPMAFHSCKFNATQINYEVNDKEFLAIVDSFEQ
jgi:hypothetical protein